MSVLQRRRKTLELNITVVDELQIFVSKKTRKSNEPFANVTVAFLVSMAYKIPSYLISDLEIRLIFVPMYGVPEFISRNMTNNRKNIRMAQDGQDY